MVNLNNWANHATKIFTRVSMFEKRLTLHGDMRTYWGFEGAKDGLAMIENSIVESPNNSKVMELVNDVRSEDAYGIDMRFNSSATLQVNNNLSISAFAINLFNMGNAKRYSYDAGILYQGPARVAFVEEPLTLGIKMNLSL